MTNRPESGKHIDALACMRRETGLTVSTINDFWKNYEMNINKSLFAPRSIIAFLLLFFAITTSAVAADKMPQTSHDGLELMKDTKLRAVYMKPGASLDQYKRIALLDCYVAFRKNWQRDYNRNEIGLEQRISDRDVERIKTKVAAEFKKIFTDELETKGGYTIVDQTGEDVLIIRPAIVNLVVNAPDKMSAGRSRTFTADPGQLTLYMELYDSVTNSIIARAIDPEAARNGGFFQMTSRVTNTADLDRVLRKWADILRNNLGEVTGNSSK